MFTHQRMAADPSTASANGKWSANFGTHNLGTTRAALAVNFAAPSSTSARFA
jgi:hypothetical protein